MSSELRFAVLLLIAGSAFVDFRVQSHLEQRFENNDTVSDVISEAPKYEAVVIYPSEVRVKLGNELTSTQVKNIPIVEDNAAPENLYTLAFIDADGSSYEVISEWEQWRVVDIPGKNVRRERSRVDTDEPSYEVISEWEQWRVVDIPGKNYRRERSHVRRHRTPKICVPGFPSSGFTNMMMMDVNGCPASE